MSLAARREVAPGSHRIQNAAELQHAAEHACHACKQPAAQRPDDPAGAGEEEEVESEPDERTRAAAGDTSDALMPMVSGDDG